MRQAVDAVGETVGCPAVQKKLFLSTISLWIVMKFGASVVTILNSLYARFKLSNLCTNRVIVLCIL